MNDLRNVPFNCNLCPRCNERFVSAYYSWGYKWLSFPMTEFEFSRMLYNNSWRVTCDYYFARYEQKELFS